MALLCAQLSAIEHEWRDDIQTLHVLHLRRPRLTLFWLPYEHTAL
jgi:hypothetical protein